MIEAHIVIHEPDDCDHPVIIVASQGVGTEAEHKLCELITNAIRDTLVATNDYQVCKDSQVKVENN